MLLICEYNTSILTSPEAKTYLEKMENGEGEYLDTMFTMVAKGNREYSISRIIL